jgi:hypothetical protein
MQEYDLDKIDEATLALMWLTMFDYGGTTRTWKGYDWSVTNRLHEKGWLGDPKGKAKSVHVTAEGERKAKELFDKLFKMDP